MERKQFTFFASFYSAVSHIRKKADRCDAYDAICAYALTGQLPDLDSMPDAAALAFDLIRPVLDSCRRKAESGKAGGKQTESKVEANSKQTGSKPEANRKREQTASDIEDEKEGEKEKENENECSISPPAPSSAKKPVAHQRSANGWVKLTDEQFSALLSDLGKDELARCIGYVDELAQSTGNKNGWKDWNLVLRRCAREGWGKRGEQKQRSPAYMSAGQQKSLSPEAWDELLNKI